MIGRAISTAGMPGLRMLAWIGRWTRLRAQFVLWLMAMAAGVVLESLKVWTWRRPTRLELRLGHETELCGFLRDRIRQ